MPDASVESRHPAHVRWSPRWRDMRDYAAGEYTLKERSRKAKSTDNGVPIPRTAGMDDEDHRLYIELASYENSLELAIAAAVGAISRKPPEIEPQPLGQDLAGDLDGEGRDLAAFLAEAADDHSETSWGALVVDGALPGDSERRPRWSWWPAESVGLWAHTAEGTLTLVTLHDEIETVTGFEHDTTRRVRELRLLPDGGAGVYGVRTWVQDQDGGWQVQMPPGAPGMPADPTAPTLEEQGWAIPVDELGAPLEEIPCVLHGPRGPARVPGKPQLEGLKDLSADHLRMLTDERWKAHNTADGTLVLADDAMRRQLDEEASDATTGKGDATPVRVGRRALLVLGTQGAFSVAEESGAGLAAIGQVVQRIEERKAAWLAHFIASEESATATEALLRANLRTASLHTWAWGWSRTLTVAARFHQRWRGQREPDAQVTVNRDFTTGALPAAELLALSQMYLSGSLPLDDYLDQLQRGERLAPGPEARARAREALLAAGLARPAPALDGPEAFA